MSVDGVLTNSELIHIKDPKSKLYVMVKLSLGFRNLDVEASLGFLGIQLSNLYLLLPNLVLLI